MDDIYGDDYPFQDKICEKQLRKDIKSNECLIFILKSNGNVIGTTSFELNFELRKCYCRSLMIKKDYHGIGLGNLFGFIFKKVKAYYDDEIWFYYAEVGTRNRITQNIVFKYGFFFCAFYRFKDRFFDNLENEFLIININKKILEYRKRDKPKILNSFEEIIEFINKFVDLGEFEKYKEKIIFDDKKLACFKNKVKIKTDNSKNSEEKIIIYFNKKSYIECVYYKNLQNIWIIEYKNNSLEEMCILIAKLYTIISSNSIRYAEVFVSAYDIIAQKAFFFSGFKISGYVPCWNYNSNEKVFEDCIVFSYNLISKDKIAEMHLVESAKELVEIVL